MIWTTEKPTKSGWYWFRGSRDEKKMDWCVFYIGKIGDILFVTDYEDRTVDDMVCRWPYSQWAGPIPEPKEQP